MFVAYVAAVAVVAMLPSLQSPLRMVVGGVLLVVYLPGLVVTAVSAIRNPTAQDDLWSMLPRMYRVHPFHQVRGLLRLPAMLLAAFFSVTFTLFLPFVATYGILSIAVHRLLGWPLPQDRRT